MVRLKIALVAVLIASPAAAQQCGTLTTCPQVSTPLAGSELLYVVQGGVSKKMTASTLGGAISPFIALVPGMTISPSTNGGLLWDNNGVLADSLAPLQTALPSLTTSQLYGGTGGAGVAQHFPAGAGVETALQQALNGTGAPVGSISPSITTPTFLSSDNLVNTSAPSTYQQWNTSMDNAGVVRLDSANSVGGNYVIAAEFDPTQSVPNLFPGLWTLVSPVNIYDVVGGLSVQGRFNAYPMTDPSAAPVVTHSGAGSSGSPTYYYRCIDQNSGYSLASPGASDSGGWPTGSLSNTQYNTITYSCPPGYSNAAIFRGNVLTAWIETNITGAGVISALPGRCGSSACTFNDGANYPVYNEYNSGNGPFPTEAWANTTLIYSNPDTNITSWETFNRFYDYNGLLTEGGLNNYGRIQQSSIPNTSPGPTVTPNTTGSATYTYYQVFHDWAGGVTTVSSATTITNGNATPNNTITCAPSNSNYMSCDILKGTSATSLATNLIPNGSVVDTGQSTSAYTAPTRNTTGDIDISYGDLTTTGGDMAIRRLTPGTGIRFEDSTSYSDIYVTDTAIGFNLPLAMGGNAITGAAGITGTQLTSTVATGTAPLVVASTTNVPYLNASSLNGATFSAPGPIGAGTPGAGAFTTASASTSITDAGLATQGVTCNSAAGLLSTTRGRCANAVPATGVKVAASPTFPSSVSAYLMQGLGGAITPGSTGNVLITISGTINAASATTVDNGVRYQISYGTGAAPTSNSVLAGTQIGGIQTYTSAIAPTAVGDVNVPFSTTYLVTGLTLGTTYWIDLAAESVTTVSDMGFTQVAVTAVEQ